MADERRNTCAHRGCSCPVAGNEKYCSARCETYENDDITTITCECGHGGCAGDVNV
jgi:hypothetical protein